MSSVEPSKRIRVLVVDDSALMRKMIGDMISSDEACEVIATARNGQETIRSVEALRPDCMTLDVGLPGMDGFEVLKYVMSEWPTPVVVLTAHTRYADQDTARCFEYGAVDLVKKPSGVISMDIGKVREELLAKIKAAARTDLRLVRPRWIEPSGIKRGPKKLLAAGKLVVIASSTGGPRALADLLPQLPSDLPAGLAVVQHMPEGFTRAMAERLNAESAIRVKEAEEGESFQQGVALIAPGGLHLTADGDAGGDKVARLVKGEKEHGVIPCADVAMRSVAPLYGKDCLGVVLTGMGSDGTEGLREIRKHGGRTLATDRATSVVYGMPRSAFEAGVVDRQVPLPRMANEIMSWARG